MQGHTGEGQGDGFHGTIKMCRLCGRTAQEFAPGRDIKKQGPHLHRCSRRAAGLAHRDNFASLDHRLCAGRSRRLPGAQDEFRNTGNARQRLAAEAHAPHGGQVRRRSDLARGVTLEREKSILAIHAGSVITDPEKDRSGTPDLDLERLRPGIETVLHQFLDHRGRTFHHLAGRHLTGHHVGQDAYATHDSPLSFDLAAARGLETLHPAYMARPNDSTPRSPLPLVP